MSDLLTVEDDELLSAFIDGTLPPGRAAVLKRRLEVEPALAARLRKLAQADAAVRNAYAPIAAEPLPQRVLDLIDAGQAAGKPDAGVVDLAARRRVRGLRLAPLPVSLAAGIALAVGVSLGYLGTSRAPAPDVVLIANAGAIASGTPLYEALETTASATTREIERGVSVTPVFTFRSVDGDYCRQVDIASARGGGEALACRRDGGWRFEAVSFTAATTTNGGFRPANRSSVIDAAIDERIEGYPLDAAAEEVLIEQRWAN
ncbi:MAG TPA: hypothetical protein VIC71_09605 [Gammaproteobacteria bacterium]|jgi:hypothetical protein